MSGFIKVVEDITEDNQLAANTQRMARMASLGEMASGVAHEINNPISGIIGCAELMRHRLASDDGCHAIVDRIIREGDRIASIVSALLSVAHPGQVKQENFSLSECLSHVMVLYQSRMINSGIDVAVHLPEDLPPLNGDRQKIEQLFLNLISNSYFALNSKFPDPAPDKRMSISASFHEKAGNGKLCLEVCDQGHGIPREILGKVFDPFFTTKPAGSGTGLGLGICYEIVKQFDGDIRVESEVGHFTRVMVELPAGRSAVDSMAGTSAAAGTG
jgi:signal transduction histidine kinase